MPGSRRWQVTDSKARGEFGTDTKCLEPCLGTPPGGSRHVGIACSPAPRCLRLPRREAPRTLISGDYSRREPTSPEGVARAPHRNGDDVVRSIEHARDRADGGRFNARLQTERRPYMVIGVGRWGSADPLLGIPVSWDQIAGGRAIVEAGFADFKVTPSQGATSSRTPLQQDVSWGRSRLVPPDASSSFAASRRGVIL